MKIILTRAREAGFPVKPLSVGRTRPPCPFTPLKGGFAVFASYIASILNILENMAYRLLNVGKNPKAGWAWHATIYINPAMNFSMQKLAASPCAVMKRLQNAEWAEDETRICYNSKNLAYTQSTLIYLKLTGIFITRPSVILNYPSSVCQSIWTRENHAMGAFKKFNNSQKRKFV